jgi:hypothetical protein
MIPAWVSKTVDPATVEGSMGACIARAGDAGGVGYVPAIGTETHRAAGERSQQHGTGQPPASRHAGGLMAPTELADNVRGALDTIDKNDVFITMTLAVMAPERQSASRITPLF